MQATSCLTVHMQWPLTGIQAASFLLAYVWTIYSYAGSFPPYCVHAWITYRYAGNFLSNHTHALTSYRYAGNFLSYRAHAWTTYRYAGSFLSYHAHFTRLHYLNRIALISLKGSRQYGQVCAHSFSADQVKLFKIPILMYLISRSHLSTVSLRVDYFISLVRVHLSYICIPCRLTKAQINIVDAQKQESFFFYKTLSEVLHILNGSDTSFCCFCLFHFNANFTLAPEFRVLRSVDVLPFKFSSWPNYLGQFLWMLLLSLQQSAFS